MSKIGIGRIKKHLKSINEEGISVTFEPASVEVDGITFYLSSADDKHKEKLTDGRFKFTTIDLGDKLYLDAPMLFGIFTADKIDLVNSERFLCYFSKEIEWENPRSGEYIFQNDPSLYSVHDDYNIPDFFPISYIRSDPKAEDPMLIFDLGLGAYWRGSDDEIITVSYSTILKLATAWKNFDNDLDNYLQENLIKPTIKYYKELVSNIFNSGVLNYIVKKIRDLPKDYYIESYNENDKIIVENINEAKSKYPYELTGSGYSLRDGEPNGWGNSYQITARTLKDGSIKFNSTYNYSKPAGTPWVRCLNESDAEKVCAYLEANGFGKLTPVKNSNEQVLKLIGYVDDVPLYVCTGEHYETKYSLDKNTGKIISSEKAQTNWLSTLSKPANLADAIYKELSKSYFNVTNITLVKASFSYIEVYRRKLTTYKIDIHPVIGSTIKDEIQAKDIQSELSKSKLIGNAYYYENNSSYNPSLLTVSLYDWGSTPIYSTEDIVKEELAKDPIITADRLSEITQRVADDIYNQFKFREKEDIVAQIYSDIMNDSFIESFTNKDALPVVWNKGPITAYRLPDNKNDIVKVLSKLGVKIKASDYSWDPEFCYIYVAADNGKGFIIEIDLNSNDLSQILKLPELTNVSESNSLAYILLKYPYLYDILNDNDITIPHYPIEKPIMDRVAEFRNKFRGNDYNEALWIIYKTIEIENEIDPWDIDSALMDNFIDELISDPIGFLEYITWQINYSTEKNWSQDTINLAKLVREKAEKLLLPDNYLEKLN